MKLSDKKIYFNEVGSVINDAVGGGQITSKMEIVNHLSFLKFIKYSEV